MICLQLLEVKQKFPMINQNSIFKKFYFCFQDKAIFVSCENDLVWKIRFIMATAEPPRTRCIDDFELPGLRIGCD